MDLIRACACVQLSRPQPVCARSRRVCGPPPHAELRWARIPRHRFLQQEAHARVQQCVGAYEPDDAIPSPQAAFHELLRGRDLYDGSSANPNLATFTSVARISPQTSLNPFISGMGSLRDRSRG